MKRILVGVLWGLLAADLLGCSRGGAQEVVVYTSVDQVFSEPIFRAFERETGIAVRAVFDTEETKSTGVLNRLLAEGRSPRTDVFWSGDPVRPFVLINHGLVEAYISPSATAIPPSFKGADGTWTGFAARARVLLVNKHRVPSQDGPRSIEDLANPRWKGQAAMANPLFGTTTMHVAALFATWGEARAGRFLEQVKANNVRIASSNGEVKRLVIAGEAAFGLVDSDDAIDALNAGVAVEVVYPDQDTLGTLVMPTAVVLIRSGPHPQNGRKLIDYLLSPDVEARMAGTAGHMPLRSAVPTPVHVRPVSALRVMPADYSRVTSEIERIQPWLRNWVGL